jgi:hypothetical protein
MREAAGVTFEELRQMALSFPDVEEGTSYGTTAFRVRKKFICRMYDDTNTTLVLPVEELERELLLNAEPETFYITDHYVGSTLVLVQLAEVSPEHLRQLFERAWRERAPRQLVAAYDHQSGK